MSDYTILNRMFTQKNIKDLIYRNNSNVYENIIREYFAVVDNCTNLDLINEIYKLLSKQYRNEYFYENTLVNKLLFGVHSPNTTVALSQIPISESKADFILINGRATVFEIKTDLDSFYRLESQLESYYKAFKYITVVTSEDKFNEIYKLLEDTPVGINVITKQDTISRTIKKDPKKMTSSLDHKVIFDMLHKSEFENIIYKHFQKLPEVAPAYYYDECFTMFKKIAMENIQKDILIEIKNRKSISVERFKTIPYPLKAISYFLNLNNKEHDKLGIFLTQNILRR